MNNIQGERIIKRRKSFESDSGAKYQINEINLRSVCLRKLTQPTPQF